ncbi:hypothetical protein [Staphylospora marina]|uniref:hypothetical protein n=1 Tax=Staphylospora marina TaxID=2490858 RepID=UPI000F5BBE58|nr:hypothetical protein [Staphylospora marina]
MWLIVFLVIFLASLGYSLWVGRAQNPKWNQRYVRDRVKRIVLLGLIYLASLLVGLALVWNAFQS